MRSYEILTYPEPVLNQTSRELLENEIRDGRTVDGHNLTFVLSEMTRLIRSTEHGIGLSAPQIGLPVRLFIIDATQRKTDPLVFINPILSDFSDEKESSAEGCLSLPGVRASVKRSVSVSITARKLDGTSFTMTAHDFLARCAQHENDHLDGITILRHAGMTARAMASKHLDRMQRMYDHRQLVSLLVAREKAIKEDKKNKSAVSTFNEETKKVLDEHAKKHDVNLEKLIQDGAYRFANDLKPIEVVAAAPIEYPKFNAGGDAFPPEQIEKAMRTFEEK